MDSTRLKNRKICLGLAAGGALLLSACTTVGPNYQQPAVATPAAFKNTSDLAPVEKICADGAWWTVFGDPVLNQLESEGLSQSPQLASALARLDQARARLGLAAADRQPSLTTNTTVQLAGETSERVLPVPPHPVTYRLHGDSYRVPFDAAYEIDLWGRVRRSVESAGAQARASEEDLAFLRLSLSADIAQAWFNLRALDAEIAVLNRTISLRQDQISLNQSRYDAGLASEIDLQRSRVELATTEADLADVKRRHEETSNALAVLIGTPVASFTVPAAASSSSTPPSIPAGLPSALLQRRPDIVSAEQTYAARTAEIGVARAAQFPTIRLTGSAGFESTDLGSLVDRSSQFWQIGPSLVFPIFDGGRTKANIQIAEAGARAALADYQQKVLIAFRETEDALVDLRLQDEQALALTRALGAARVAADLSQKRYDKGLVNFLEVIDAERTELSSERSLVQLNGARLVSTVRLIKALGGGWSTPAESKSP